MSLIKPFSALRPGPENAKSVACVPYDVVYESEVREYISKNPLSFLRVTRAEAEFPAGSHPDPSKVFDRALENFEWFIRERILSQTDEDELYVYQLQSGNHCQTGVVGCCAIDEYEAGRIKKHENVRPDKVEDRTAHLLALGAQTGLIFLGFRGTTRISELIQSTIAAAPLFEFECPEGLMQRVWRVSNAQSYIDAFAEVESLYIADGHHRIESAKRARAVRRAANPNHTGREAYNYVVTGMFPAEDLRILAYNRVVKDLNGVSEAELLERIGKRFEFTETGEKVPHRKGEMFLYLPGRWFKLRFTGEISPDSHPIERLDVTILHDQILNPILGIGDERTDKRIGFVGGIRGTAELERLVDEGIAAAAFSMFPTTMEDLFAVSDMGETMPPKSTWFEPKLKDGLLIHLI
ncbi:MAG: DUF1015 domain-containing protein [Acidobacteria bacterium]|nr:DUF1015 domain-containing protein [Acidobacteriota bacterium]